MLFTLYLNVALIGKVKLKGNVLALN